MQAVNQMNVQGRQTRQGMQEMEQDRQRRDGGTRRDRDKPRCNWKDSRRRAGGTEAAEGWRDKRGELQGTTRGESRAQGHKQGGRESAGRARARRCGAEGRANEAEDKRRGGSGVRRGCGGGARGPPPRAGHRTLRDAERRSGAIPAIPGEAARIHSENLPSGMKTTLKTFIFFTEPDGAFQGQMQDTQISSMTAKKSLLLVSFCRRRK
ncbi:uncharacterized protein LOC119703486 isoform X2 [Motacilla alba alba]|uniref:uncharacterized protein LOC119703486 isoform X2 n=2 Tax=Motacilla alba alba TaxID=1094192 RepID=UPI0018D57EB1|nr:uncharacterized protein LOC119703486 isoform X2 [Motacilla alba alba]